MCCGSWRASRWRHSGSYMKANREMPDNPVDLISKSELNAARGYLESLTYESECIDSDTAAELDAAAAESGDDISLDEVRRRLGL